MFLIRDEFRIHEWKIFVLKRRFPVRKNENWFSAHLPHVGAKKKLVARISKSEPLILKSKPLIFCPLKTTLKHAPKMRTKRRHRSRHRALHHLRRVYAVARAALAGAPARLARRGMRRYVRRALHLLARNAERHSPPRHVLPAGVLRCVRRFRAAAEKATALFYYYLVPHITVHEALEHHASAFNDE